MRFFGSLLQATHMDRALEHMCQFGFCDQLVRETVKELLKVGFYLFVFLFLLKQGHSWDLVVFDTNKVYFTSGL